MKTQANSISEIINGINLKEEIKTIIFFGRYCSNEILVNLIKNNLKKITIYLQSSNPSLVLMEGAVLFGIEPSIIKIRKAKYTIVCNVADPWDDKIHSGKGRKFYDKDFKKIYYCGGCFDKFIEINQNLIYEKEISQEYFLDKKEKNFIFNFYKTKKTNLIFCLCKINIDKEIKNIEERKLKISYYLN